MPEPLSDSDAALLCRTHQPSNDEIRRIVRWAMANPTAGKLAPILVLFTRHFASSQYEVVNDIYEAMARCAASDATALWECVNGDYDTGRICAALRVLARIGVTTSSADFHLDQRLWMTNEARRSSWPTERDQLPITPGSVDLTEEEARAICQSFKPALTNIRRVLDWGLAAPSPGKVPYILILQTNNFAFGNWFAEPMVAVLTACAAIDPAPLMRTIAGDHEPYRIWAATRALLPIVSPDILAELVALTPEAIGWMARDEIIAAARARGMRIPDEAIGLSQRDRDWKPHPDLDRRKLSWPKAFDSPVREPRRYTLGLQRPETSYSTTATQLTVSLERIRVWGEANHPQIARDLNTGLSQEQIIELASELPYPLPAEVCELYRWRNGSSTWGLLDVWRPFLPLSEVIETYHREVEFARDYPGFWQWEWLPLFDEGKSKMILALTDRPSPTAALYEYYAEGGGEPEPAYPSLTIMMAVHADAYEELGRVPDDEWFDQANAAVERARRGHGLLSDDL